ncbi:MAG: sortase [Chloroflexi bacterium]|nr:sortase [Chloroflexota bacterium]
MRLVHLVSLLIQRLIPALLMAGGVTVIAAGLLSYTAPPVVGEVGALPGAGSTASASAAPAGTESAGPNASPGGSPQLGSTSPRPTRRPAITPTPSPSAAVAVASRVVVPALDIDLPVVAGDLEVPGNAGNYPLCDVAQYLTVYAQPGQVGTTYLYGHAREGMFLPLLEESERQDGQGMLGALIQVYTSDGRVYLYELFEVKRHATDFALANDLEPGEHRLILQTSEGPRGTVPKLQIAARLLNDQPADLEESNPEPAPVACA